MAYKQEKYTAYTSGGWESKFKVPAWLHESSLTDNRIWLFLHKVGGSRKLSEVFYKVPIPFMRTPS